MICWTLDLNTSYNFDIETIQISFRRLRQTYANDRRLVPYFQQARFDILHNQPIINTLNWNSADIIAFPHLPSIDKALTFE